MLRCCSTVSAIALLFAIPSFARADFLFRTFGPNDCDAPLALDQ
jgi:hypothetical protein